MHWFLFLAICVNTSNKGDKQEVFHFKEDHIINVWGTKVMQE